MNQRELFFRHLAQTSPEPMALEIVKAEGCNLIDAAGNSYLDLVGGISVANVGHRHPRVIEAIQKQLDAYLHIMVYGEFIESPQVQYASLLAKHLPASLNTVYFTNSGAEAVEGAMKLAKRSTGRTGIIAFKNSYHGSTQGALSIMGDEQWRNAFRPLLPGIRHLNYNSFEDLEQINEDTACVVAEPVQAEAGIIAPFDGWMQALRKKCDDTGTLLVLDEIQTGFGRTGKLWGFEHFNIVPDILLLGKALGGGMPLGAFIACKSMMQLLTINPVLGHITTFGGHPVSCAAGMAAMKVLLNECLVNESFRKEKLLNELLQEKINDHIQSGIKDIRSFGLWMAIQFESAETNKKVIEYCNQHSIITDWFLFSSDSLRISPPLIIKDEQLFYAIRTIFAGLKEIT